MKLEIETTIESENGSLACGVYCMTVKVRKFHTLTCKDVTNGWMISSVIVVH